MFQSVVDIFSRFRKPRTINEALIRVLTPSTVRESLRSVLPCDLIDHLAPHSRFSLHELLNHVASLLDMQAWVDLDAPTPEVIRLTGHSEKVLRAIHVLPQFSFSSRSPYQLVVADPSLIDLGGFREQHIPVLLATGSSITAAWKEYDTVYHVTPRVHLEQGFSVMRRLAVDAHALGASEVFVGHPTVDGYDFLANGKRYGGKLHRDIYDTLLQGLSTTGQLSEECSDCVIREITLALTRNFERPVICLNWQLQDCEVRTAELSVVTGGKTVPESVTKGDSSVVPKVVTAQEPALEAIDTYESETSDTENESDAAEQITEPVVEIRGVGESRRTVLLVDDDERFITVLTRVLESRNWKVHSVRDGQAALSAIEGTGSTGTAGEDERISPDLIICDVHMPVMDGAHFVNSLRERDFSYPVLMLTSDEDQEVEAELAMLGADAFVRKHDDLRILLAWCNNLTAPRRGARALVSQNTASTYTNGTPTNEHIANGHLTNGHCPTE